MSTLAIAPLSRHLRVPAREVQPIPLSSPDISQEDRERVLAILSGTTLSLGPALPAFEAAMAEAAGTRYRGGSQLRNQRPALVRESRRDRRRRRNDHDAVQFRGLGELRLYERAIPRFVDIDIDTYNIDNSQIARASQPHCAPFFRSTFSGVLQHAGNHFQSPSVMASRSLKTPAKPSARPMKAAESAVRKQRLLRFLPQQANHHGRRRSSSNQR